MEVWHEVPKRGLREHWFLLDKKCEESRELTDRSSHLCNVEYAYGFNYYI